MRKPRVRSTVVGVRGQLERLEKRTYANPRMTYSVPGLPSPPRSIGIDTGAAYWWALGYTNGGKRCVLGPYGSEVEADFSVDKLNDPETFELKTRDPAKAVKQIRAILLKSGVAPDEAITRQLHKRGLARELERR